MVYCVKSDGALKIYTYILDPYVRVVKEIYQEKKKEGTKITFFLLLSKLKNAVFV
jgi:hypothetical protein